LECACVIFWQLLQAVLVKTLKIIIKPSTNHLCSLTHPYYLPATNVINLRGASSFNRGTLEAFYMLFSGTGITGDTPLFFYL
jgi:hypothetical protein